MSRKRIGIFGGTFDPPHNGHLALAAAALRQLKLDRVLWMLTPCPPHKRGQEISSADHRLEMVLLTIAAEPRYQLSRLEFDRPQPHYSVDTLGLVREQHPDDALIFLMGGDSLRDLPAWHRPAELVRRCDELGVLRRPDDQVDLPALEAILPGLTEKVRFVDAPPQAAAAREIRLRLQAGQPVDDLVPPPVIQYIQEHNLYA